MQPHDVTMYGRDYSAREFSDAEFREYMKTNPGERRVDFLGRYIGYPTNPKCISHYPGMYRHHLSNGRPSFLFHQIGYTDMGTGFDGGRAHATIALADARSERVGWDGESHIVACMDRFYAKAGYVTLTREQLREYMRGFRSVLGDRAGFYGFYDSMAHAIDEEWASFYVQCGARSAHVPGIHAWQENNYQPRVFGTPTDILELYCDPAYAFGGGLNMNEEQMKQLAEYIADAVNVRVLWGPRYGDGERNLVDSSIESTDRLISVSDKLPELITAMNTAAERLGQVVNLLIDQGKKEDKS